MRPFDETFMNVLFITTPFLWRFHTHAHTHRVWFTEYRLFFSPSSVCSIDVFACYSDARNVLFETIFREGFLWHGFTSICLTSLHDKIGFLVGYDCGRLAGLADLAVHVSHFSLSSSEWCHFALEITSIIDFVCATLYFLSFSLLVFYPEKLK